jgi:gliding motility-associated-like protein
MELTGTGSVVLTEGTTCIASTSFGAGTTVIMSGKPFYCVYNGTGNSVNITGLAPNTLYRLTVVEYKGTAGNEKYLNTGQSPGNMTTSAPPLNALIVPKAQSGSAVPMILTSGNEKVEANNILSPNDDGINDIWVIKNIAFYPDNTVTVYNRAGEIVFTKKGYANDWDGTYRSSVLSEGTYYYRIDLGNGKIVKGFITAVGSR